MSIWSHYFLAIQLTPPVKRAIAQRLHTLRDDMSEERIQLVPSPVLSLPLVLLGDQPRESMELVLLRTREISRGCSPMSLSPRRWLVEERGGRRLLSLELRDRYQQLSFLTRSLNEVLAAEGFEGAKISLRPRIPCGLSSGPLRPPKQLPRFQLEVDQIDLFERPEDYRLGGAYRSVWTVPLSSEASFLERLEGWRDDAQEPSIEPRGSAPMLSEGEAPSEALSIHGEERLEARRRALEELLSMDLSELSSALEKRAVSRVLASSAPPQQEVTQDPVSIKESSRSSRVKKEREKR